MRHGHGSLGGPFDVKPTCTGRPSSQVRRMYFRGVALRTAIFTGSQRRRVRAFEKALNSFSSETLNGEKVGSVLEVGRTAGDDERLPAAGRGNAILQD
jgi:hypothetical protein